MTATLRNVAGTYGQANDGVITFGVDELTSSFSVGFDMIVKFLLSLPVSNSSTKTNMFVIVPFRTTSLNYHSTYDVGNLTVRFGQ